MSSKTEEMKNKGVYLLLLVAVVVIYLLSWLANSAGERQAKTWKEHHTNDMGVTKEVPDSMPAP